MSMRGAYSFVDRIISMRVRDWALLIFLALFVSACGVVGWSYGASGEKGVATQTPIGMVLLTAIFTIVAMAVFLFCDAGLARLARPSSHDVVLQSEGAPSKLNWLIPQMTPRSIALFAGILIIFWMPYIIAAFPGSTHADTPIQMQQLYEGMHPLDVLSGGYVYISPEAAEHFGPIEGSGWHGSGVFPTDAQMVDHHPFAVTLLYGGLAQASDALFGNWMPAVALLLAMQVILFSGELSFSLAYLRHKGAPAGLCVAALAFFCLVPLVPNTVVSVMKDSAFALFFIPLFLMLAESVFTKGACFKSKGFVVGFVLAGVGLCLTRKSGVFVVVAVAFFGAVLYGVQALRSRRADGLESCRVGAKAAALAFGLQGVCCIALMAAIVPGVIYPALDIAPGGRQEMLGTLFQQTARTYMDHDNGSFTDEEREAVRGVLSEEKLRDSYSALWTDPVKEKHYLDASPEDLKAYLQAYVSMGLRFPESYLASVMCVASGFLSPVHSASGWSGPRGAVWAWSLSFDGGREVLWVPEATQGLLDALRAAYDVLDDAPVISLLFRGVLYDLWIPALMLFFCVRNRLHGGILVVPFAMTLFICIVSPIYDLRYIYAVILMVPVLIGAMGALARRTLQERAVHAAKEPAAPQNGKLGEERSAS